MPTHRTLTTSLVVGLGVIAASMLTGCDPASQRPQATSLVESIRASDGVKAAKLDYTEPLVLDSGKLDIQVKMSPNATTDQVADVVDIVYEGFSGTHVDEEGDLDVRFSDDRVHLRTFEPEAEPADVRTQTEAVLEQADRGRLDVSVLADDVPSDPGVQTLTTLRLPDGSTRDDVLPALDRLQTTYGADKDLSWQVRAADGAGLAGDDSSPSDVTRERWQALSSVKLSGAYMAVDYDEYAAGNGDLYPTASVTVLGMDAPLSLDDRATYRRLMRLATAQIEQMQDYATGVSYGLLLEGKDVADVDTDLGTFGRGTGKRFAAELADATGIDG